jgi:hypothetical protein
VQRNEDVFPFKTSESLRALLGVQICFTLLTMLSETTILKCNMFSKVDSFRYSGKGNRANFFSNFWKPHISEPGDVETTFPADHF